MSEELARLKAERDDLRIKVNTATKTEYVRVPEIDPEGEAYREALRREVRLEPKLQGYVERIESTKEQLMAGAKADKRGAQGKFGFGWSD